MRIVKLDTNFILPQCREPAIGRGTKTAQLRTFSKLLGTLTQAQPECMDSTLEKIPEVSLRSRVGDFVEGLGLRSGGGGEAGREQGEIRGKPDVPVSAAVPFPVSCW